MNRSHTSRSIYAALAVVVLLIAMAGLPGATGSSAEATVVTRRPRAHPISHLTVPPGIDLIRPRPHPTSHIGRALDRP